MNVLDRLEAAPLPGRERYRTWAACEPALLGVGVRQLRPVLLEQRGSFGHEHRDDVLAALIRLSRLDDQAGLLLVRCLLPGLRVTISRHGWGVARDEATAVAVAALWRRIAIYPLERRPRKIALNLLLDTSHDLIAMRNKELRYRANAYPTDRHGDRADERDGPSAACAMWDAVDRSGVLTDRELALIRSTHVHDLPIAQVAPLIGMTHEAARKARQRAIYKLRAWWDSGEEAA